MPEVETASKENDLRFYVQEYERLQIPITLAPGKSILLVPGEQAMLIEQVIYEFASRYIPGGEILYIGDLDTPYLYLDEAGLMSLGITIEAHSNMPTIIIYQRAKNWLILIEAVPIHNPIDRQRKKELQDLFIGTHTSLMFVTAFLTRAAMIETLCEIAWVTDVWAADAPAHLLHLGEEICLRSYKKL